MRAGGTGPGDSIAAFPGGSEGRSTMRTVRRLAPLALLAADNWEQVEDARGPAETQELIVRDKVQMLTGVVWTPNAMAIAPLTAEAKIPFVISNAGASVITTRSPYIARASFTLWQSSYPMGQWAARKFKRAYIAVTDFSPGHDCEEAFEKAKKLQ